MRIDIDVRRNDASPGAVAICGDAAVEVALSFFVPLLIGTGGNAGSQTVATVIAFGRATGLFIYLR